MLELSKRLGLCLGIAASFCLAACGGDDSGSSGGSSEQEECSTNDDCKDVAGKPVCDTDKRECVADSSEQAECKEDADCKDSSKPKCNSGKCEADTSTTEPECSDSKPCGDGKKCDGGKCVEDQGGGGGDTDECSQDSDCSATQECKDKKCVDKEMEQDKEDKCDDPSQTPCDDTCVNLNTDPKNCGACGTACNSGESCQSGSCKKDCTGGTTLCGTECIDLESNETCGTCDAQVACKVNEGETCNNGKCVSACSNEGQVFCNGACVDFNSNKDNCGGCTTDAENHACEEGQKCSNGVCGKDCGEGQVDCDGSCINPQENPDFCGADAACQNFEVCGEGLSCKSGKCSCTSDSDSLCKISDTESVCTDPKTSNEYCGCGEDNRDNPAGINCTALAGTSESACNDGVCKFTCAEGRFDCDEKVETGCEADLTSPETCGACNVKCEDPNAESALCVEGVCEFVCKDKMKSCDGKCADILKDKDNCGYCGHKCGDDATCEGGFCVISDEKCDGDGFVTTSIEGSDVKAFCVRTKQEFEAIRDAINSKKTYPLDSSNSQNAYILMTNIDIGNGTWVPIGNANVSFTGIFLGNGKVVSGTLNSTADQFGLFGRTSGANIHGFNAKINVKSQNAYVGGLVGYATGSTLISYSTNDATLTTQGSVTYSHNGILVGYLGSSTIESSQAFGTITAASGNSTMVGALVGYAGSSKINNCYAKANMSVSNGGSTYGNGILIGRMDRGQVTNSSAAGTAKLTGGNSSWQGIGGLIGWVLATNATVDHCSSSVDVESSGQRAGSLIGFINYTSGNCGAMTVSNSYSTGSVKCAYNCGGLIGSTYNSVELTGCTLTVDNSWSSSNVTSTRSGAVNYIGGLIGYAGNSEITNSYTTGKVTGPHQYIGGLVGYTHNSTYQNVYTTGDVTATTKDAQWAGGLIGYLQSSTVTNAYTKGNVSGGKDVGGIVAHISGSVVQNCESFGNVSNTKFVSSMGDWAGGISAAITDGGTLINCMAVGDVSGGKYVGGAVGGVARGNNTIQNVYSSGLVNGTSYGNALVGIFDNSDTWGSSNHDGTLAIKRSYYWEKAGDTAVGGNTPNQASAYAFKYNDSKEAVFSGRKLAQELGDEWIPATCKLKSGPKEEVTIPVLQIFGADVCK